MERIPVSSSTIAAIAYDPKTMTLEVDFLNGNQYEYFDVSEMIFNDFKNAGSKGRFLDQHIKKAGYRYGRK